MRICFLTILLILFGICEVATQDLSKTHENQTSIDRMLEESEDDLSVLLTAYKLSDSLNYTDGKKKAALLLFNYYQNYENYEKASAYHLKYLEYKDELFFDNEEKIKKELSQKYHPEKKESELKLLRSRNQLELLNLERKRLILVSILSGLILLIIIVFLFYRRYRTKQNARVILDDQNEEFNKTNEKLKNLNQELETSDQDLRSLNQTKDRFFQLVSEELRSPLFSLSGLLSILIKEGKNFTKDEVNDFALKINDAVNSLLELIENLLQWSRIQINTITYEKEDLELSEILKENIQFLKLQADTKSIEINTDNIDNAMVTGDKNMIHFIVKNLILNAIKFCLPASKIQITLEPGTEMSRVLIEAVCDEDLVENISNLWESEAILGEASIKDEKTSLGLLLTKFFVERNSGTVGVIHDNSITKFELRLPFYR